MRRFRVTLASAVAAAILLLAAAPPARAEVDFGFFYDQLSPYGEWTQHASFGWVWTPSDVPATWRPYTRGHWVWTDEGNVWVADEEWGWIPSHYGRWAFDPDGGWFWIPGTVWAPAWVSWRSGGGYVGWAPLPPAIGFSISAGFAFDGFGFDDIDESFWSFVPESQCYEPEVDRVVVVRARNRVLLRDARTMTRFEVEKGHVVDRSIDDDHLKRWLGRVPPKVRIEETAEVGRGHREEVRGDRLSIARPLVTAKPLPEGPRNRAETERKGFPGGFDAEREHVRARQQLEHEQLNQVHRQELEKAKEGRAALQYRHQEERLRLEDLHNRENRRLLQRQPASQGGGGQREQQRREKDR
jgi:hypothetical protein